MNKSKFLLIILLILQIIVTICGFVTPIFGAQFTVKFTSNQFMQAIIIELIVMVILITSSILSYFITILSQKIFNIISINMEDNIGREILKISNDDLDKIGTGVLINMVTSDTKEICSSLDSILSYLLNILNNIGTFVLVLFLSPIAFLWLTLTSIVRFFIEKKRLSVNGKLTKKYKKDQLKY